MKNPLIPMGAITGCPSRTEIEEILKLYADCGIQQFLIYPRSGCEIPYMSDRWIELCRDILELSEKMGIDIWLYDEVNWPSGSCGGKVIKDNPTFASKGIHVIDGKCVIEEFPLYSDILNPDAVDAFIQNTHEVYYKHFSKYFGTVIKGIFTDEPDFFYPGVYGKAKYTYTKDLEKMYFEKCGRDLFSDMAKSEPDNDFKIVYMDILSDLFRKNYIGKINSWCLSHNIVLTGHINIEHIIEKAIRTSGGQISALRTMSLPAIDEIRNLTEIDKAEWLNFGCAEAAIRSSENGGLAELFACAPTHVSPGRIEQVLWLISMFKIDHFVLAVSAVDARGNLMKDRWYNPMNYTSPWFSGYKELGETAKKASIFAKKNVLSEVFIRYPYTETVKTFYTKKEGIINKRLYDTIKALIRGQFQWQFLDEKDEAPEKAFVIEINSDDNFSLENIMTKVENTFTKSFYVTENGALADELFIRKFTDGSIVLIDLKDSSEERFLTLVRNGAEETIRLPGRGHYILGEKALKCEEVISEIAPKFTLSLNSDNSLRCSLHSDKKNFTFTVSNEITDLYLAVRNYHFDEEIMLDGKLIKANGKCTCFTKGLNELYSTSDRFSLSPGVHSISMRNFHKSEPYFPLCFLCGKFILDNNALCSFNRSIDTSDLRKAIPEYTGVITYSEKINIPYEKCFLEFDSSELYTKVFIDEELLSTSLSHCRFEIPEKHQGNTVNIKIEQYTTVAPMFGYLPDAVSFEDYDEAWLKAKTSKQKSGVRNLRFTK